MANKGEISFTVYTLFSGAIMFPGQGIPFWSNGTGHLLGGTAIPENEYNGSRAIPPLALEEFRLF